MSEEITSLRAVFVDQLRDLYSAETLIAKALPTMAKAASAPPLKSVFKHHLAQTKEHVARIKSVCAELKVKPTGKTCRATVGLIEEAKEAMEEDALPEMKDLMMIAAARRVEHYEMSGYISVCELAKALGLGAVAKTLAVTLSEEKAADAVLAKESRPAFAKAFAAEKATETAEEPGVVEEAGKAIKKIVRKITS